MLAWLRWERRSVEVVGVVFLGSVFRHITTAGSNNTNAPIAMSLAKFKKDIRRAVVIMPSLL
jgi:hypothetical protein